MGPQWLMNTVHVYSACPSLKNAITKNIYVEKTYVIRKVGGGGGQAKLWKKKVSVGLFSMFCHPLVQNKKPWGIHEKGDFEKIICILNSHELYNCERELDRVQRADIIK